MNELETVAPAFVAMAHRIVWCTGATVGRDGRPVAVLHPIWEWDGGQLRGWIATSPLSPKAVELAGVPAISLNYWAPNHDTCTADCAAEFETDPAAVEAGWRRFAEGPAPVGYDPSIIPGWDSPRRAELRSAASGPASPEGHGRHPDGGRRRRAADLAREAISGAGARECGCVTAALRARRSSRGGSARPYPRRRHRARGGCAGCRRRAGHPAPRQTHVEVVAECHVEQRAIRGIRRFDAVELGVERGAQPVPTRTSVTTPCWSTTIGVDAQR